MKKILLKVLEWFLILYVFIYILTFSIRFLSNNYERFEIKLEHYSLLLNILIYVPIFGFLVFIVSYLRIQKQENLFFIKKGKELKKIFISLILIYFGSFLVNPFYHNFNSDKIPVFEFNSIPLNDNIIEILSVILIAPIFEELFFRALLLNPFIKEKKVLFGVIITSLLYSISHLYITSISYHVDYIFLINYFLIGIIFSVLRVNFGLIYAIIAHFIYNLLTFLYDKEIINLFVLDYINFSSLYWSIYILMMLLIVFLVYRISKLDSITRSR
ncbi:CPBP family intramembrane glutamic endopeptidase [Lutibacter sp. HS1-25]|uniref:CPBP family intramembrane glutamic endopeptidase n=1 Tax=Lutibacter sp. HS1-25 TaxID=2485000 RepID=UPI0013E904C6|nr:type II CAAX endopeptidase family protein [Lutibacter sp. HS1-25]